MIKYGNKTRMKVQDNYSITRIMVEKNGKIICPTSVTNITSMIATDV